MKDFFSQKFSQDAQQSLNMAQNFAAESRLMAIGTEHILVGVLSIRETLASELLQDSGVTLEKIHLILRFPNATEMTTSEGMTDNARRALQQAMLIAKEYNHPFVEPEHILLALIVDQSSAAYRLLRNLGINPERLRQQLERLFSQSVISTLTPEPAMTATRRRSSTPALNYFATDLVQLASEGKLDSVIGRDIEITRVIQVLNRRTKNNPVLLGEPGVGKTAIVEGLAQRIVKGDIPSNLSNKRILSLDLALMVAGTKYRGEFEERIKKVIEEVKRDKNIILFVDELHTIVGAGSAEGSMDAANILKPPLSRGELWMIGATTLDEYRKHIEKDAALERRLQPIEVPEPSVLETIEILKGIKNHYEKHHNVTISDDSIITAAQLAKKYIQDRFLPDKAIDLIDEAASASRIKANKVLKDTEYKKIEDKLRKVLDSKEKMVREQNFEEAVSLREEELRLRKSLSETNISKGSVINIMPEDIARVVAMWTGVPVTRLLKEESKRYINLDKIIKSRIIGQDEAVEAVAKSIKRSRTGISNPKRPLGSFIFMGPTGVGKTELAKVLASEVFEREDALIKIDMSEFMERHNVSRLIGAPPGYVGYEESGKLTEAIRRHPYSVVLLDEIEKAHSEVFNLLLQILEDGYLTDAKGKKIDFTHTIIIMTSNIGMEALSRQAEIGFRAKVGQDKKAAMEKYDQMKDKILGELKNKFRPEFLNRVDKVIVFKPLDKDDINQIVQLQINDLVERLKEQKIQLEVDEKAKLFIAKAGYDPENGARPIRRAIQTMIEDQLAEGILDGRFSSGSTIVVTQIGDSVLLQAKKKIRKLIRL